MTRPAIDTQPDRASNRVAARPAMPKHLGPPLAAALVIALVAGFGRPGVVAAETEVPAEAMVTFRGSSEAMPTSEVVAAEAHQAAVADLYEKLLQRTAARAPDLSHDRLQRGLPALLQHPDLEWDVKTEESPAGWGIRHRCRVTLTVPEATLHSWLETLRHQRTTARHVAMAVWGGVVLAWLLAFPLAITIDRRTGGYRRGWIVLAMLLGLALVTGLACLVVVYP